MDRRISKEGDTFEGRTQGRMLVLSISPYIVRLFHNFSTGDMYVARTKVTKRFVAPWLIFYSEIATISVK
jgi:hypothetical protein